MQGDKFNDEMNLYRNWYFYYKRGGECIENSVLQIVYFQTEQSACATWILYVSLDGTLPQIENRGWPHAPLNF